jgi:hypothetical protein
MSYGGSSVISTCSPSGSSSPSTSKHGRRERASSVKKQVLVSVDRGETRVALLEKKQDAKDYRVAELYLERRGQRSIVGNIYKGKVDNVLPGLEAAFVDIGLDKNGFLHVDEIVCRASRRRGAAAARRAARRSPTSSSPARRSSARSSRTR